MPEAISHRSRILSSIRTALNKSGEAPLMDASAVAAEYNNIERNYQRSGALSHHALIDLFLDRLREYDSGVYQSSAASIPASIAEILTHRGKRIIAVPDGLSVEWLPGGFNFQPAGNFGKHQLSHVDGLLSACTVAIAETGSIVLQNAPAQGARLLSLVPDYHLCVVFADQIFATVPEAFARLAATAHLPTTFISGPSATADIEMTRIKGVHGPRFLDVLIVQG